MLEVVTSGTVMMSLPFLINISQLDGWGEHNVIFSYVEFAVTVASIDPGMSAKP